MLAGVDATAVSVTFADLLRVRRRRLSEDAIVATYGFAVASRAAADGAVASIAAATTDDVDGALLTAAGGDGTFASVSTTAVGAPTATGAAASSSPSKKNGGPNATAVWLPAAGALLLVLGAVAAWRYSANAKREARLRTWRYDAPPDVGLRGGLGPDGAGYGRAKAAADFSSALAARPGEEEATGGDACGC